MLYMVIERFRSGKVSEIRRRFLERGRMMPEGLVFKASWIEPSGERCFQLMECADRAFFERWIAAWDDLMEFEVVEVLDSSEFWRRFDSGRTVESPPTKD